MQSKTQSSCGNVVYFVFVMLVKQFAHAKGGQPELLKCGGGAGFTVLSNDISILISLGVIVKCLPAARRGAKMLAVCHVDYGFNVGIYISFLFEAHKSASSPRQTNAD